MIFGMDKDALFIVTTSRTIIILVAFMSNPVIHRVVNSLVDGTIPNCQSEE